MSQIIRTESLEKKSEQEGLETVLEVNESEILDRLQEIGEFREISPRVFTLLDISEPYTQKEALHNANYELGVIDLCWPVIEDPVFETRTCFPKSYYHNTNKERLLLAYAENFRRQFYFHYPMKTPLLLQAPNECGLMKMVCTTVRPTKLCYGDTNTWQGVASLVADYFNYEPLEKPMLHPERIMSPYTTIIRRSGNPFELATVCVSWLIGSGYDAYVVVGTAIRDVCMAIRYRTVCPDVPDETEKVEEEAEPEEEPRYQLVPLPDLTSHFILAREQYEANRIQAKLDKIENERLRKIADLEKAPPDAIDGWRIHAWVLVLPGMKGVEEPFFIEPSEGFPYPLSARRYQRLYSVYNHENYYANVQEEEDLEKLNYDISDVSCWEHLLAGEPMRRRVMVGVDLNDKSTAVDTDKHLDMPASWVEKLSISAEDYLQRYPGFQKRIHYKKVVIMKYSPYSQPDGIVHRLTIYEDYALTKPLLCYETYKYRKDMMDTVKTDYVNKTICEKFLDGRKEYLKKHSYTLEALPLSIESVRTLEFDYNGRFDQLVKVECGPLFFNEYFQDRDDKLESRLIIYSEPNKGETGRQLLRVTETYGRNMDLPPRKDIWKRIFNTQDGTIDLLYHYDYNFVTNNTRNYIKPNLAETGGQILFYPDKTSGYIADPNAPMPRPLDVYVSLCDHITWEDRTAKHIRDVEGDVNDYLALRHKELTEPQLEIDLYDTQVNEAAKKGWIERETARAEVTEREKEAEIDPLAPYLARMLGSGHGAGYPLSLKEAILVREQCINDFKTKQLMRQQLVFDRYEQSNNTYKNRRLWYLANQFILTPPKEEAYLNESAQLAFQVHNLEVRLTRHQDLSAPRFKVLTDYLAKHPLLVNYNRCPSFYRKAINI